jgi:N-acyl amino acid synthase of PEP-CTERM/exosortase system
MSHLDFYNHFVANQATTRQQVQKCHRIRYDVYCEQQGFEPVNKEKLERDGLDAQAHHNLICCGQSQTPVATSRMLFQGMPLYSLIGNSLLPNKEYCGELSRYCVDHLKMRSIMDNVRQSNSELAFKLKKYGALLLSPALMKLNMISCLEADRPYLLGITEKRLVKKMNILGFAMEAIGPEIEYHGMRQPFLFRVEKTFDRMKKGNLDFWKFMTNDGELHDKAHALVEKLDLY